MSYMLPAYAHALLRSPPRKAQSLRLGSCPTILGSCLSQRDRKKGKVLPKHGCILIALFAIAQISMQATNLHLNQL